MRRTNGLKWQGVLRKLQPANRKAVVLSHNVYSNFMCHPSPFSLINFNRYCHCTSIQYCACMCCTEEVQRINCFGAKSILCVCIGFHKCVCVCVCVSIHPCAGFSSNRSGSFDFQSLCRTSPQHLAEATITPAATAAAAATLVTMTSTATQQHLMNMNMDPKRLSLPSGLTTILFALYAYAVHSRY